MDNAARRQNIFIVDDHPLVRRGYSYLFRTYPDLHICGEAAGVEEALEKIRKAVPDLVVTDIAMGGPSGLDLIKSLHAEWPSLPILVVSMHEESDYAWRAFRSGARGYVVKHRADGIIIDAVETLLKGGFYLSEEITRTLVTEFQDGVNGKMRGPVGHLTDREMEIFHLCGQGMTFRQISDSLHISIKTVETHRTKIRAKINASSNADLIRKAVQWVSQQ